MTPRWPDRLAVREGWSAALAARWVSVTVVVACALVMGSAAVASTLEVAKLTSAERDWVERGGLTYIVSSGTGDPRGIDVQACERLGAIDGVRGSFAVAVTDRGAEVATAPGTQATWVRASPGIHTFFGARPAAGPSVLVTEVVARPTGLVDGERTRVSVAPAGGGPVGAMRVDVMTVTVTFLERDVLDEVVAGAFLSPDLVEGRATQCYVEAWAPHAAVVEGHLVAALSVDASTPAAIKTRVPRPESGHVGGTAFRERILAWTWVPGAAVLVALWAVVQTTRRTRMAIYATFGAHRRARLLIQLTEWVVMSGVGAVWAWGSAVALGIGLGVEAEVVLVQTSAQIVAVWCATTVGAVVVALAPAGSLLAQLKDRS